MLKPFHAQFISMLNLSPIHIIFSTIATPQKTGHNSKHPQGPLSLENCKAVRSLLCYNYFSGGVLSL